jgi:hypothetical protein
MAKLQQIGLIAVLSLFSVLLALPLQTIPETGTLGVEQCDQDLSTTDCNIPSGLFDWLDLVTGTEPTVERPKHHQKHRHH